MLSPLLGIAGVNSLLFTAYATSKRIISPFPDLSLKQIAGAGAMAGGVNSLLAAPGKCDFCFFVDLLRYAGWFFRLYTPSMHTS
jgi:hypothetical protein